jgi:hypothetical protein
MNETLRVLVCGGRDFANRALVFSILDAMRSASAVPLVIIHGAARGADSLGAAWAQARDVQAEAYPADWHPNGGPLDRAAGLKRNQTMLDAGKPDLCVAFPGGNGTAHMVRLCRAAGVLVHEVAA